MSERDDNTSVWVVVLLAVLLLAVINLYGATIQNYQKIQWELRDAQHRIAELEQRQR